VKASVNNDTRATLVINNKKLKLTFLQEAKVDCAALCPPLGYLLWIEAG